MRAGWRTGAVDAGQGQEKQPGEVQEDGQRVECRVTGGGGGGGAGAGLEMNGMDRVTLQSQEKAGKSSMK